MSCDVLTFLPSRKRNGEHQEIPESDDEETVGARSEYNKRWRRRRCVPPSNPRLRPALAGRRTAAAASVASLARRCGQTGYCPPAVREADRRLLRQLAGAAWPRCPRVALRLTDDVVVRRGGRRWTGLAHD